MPKQIEAETYQPPADYRRGPDGTREKVVPARIAVGDTVRWGHMKRTLYTVKRIFKNGPRGQWRLELVDSNPSIVYTDELAANYRKAES